MGASLIRLLLSSTAMLWLGCAQDMHAIIVVDPKAPAAPQKCGVRGDALVTHAQALCIAKVSGLERGVTKWTVREYPDYLDVFNTTVRQPVERGMAVRMQRRGGIVVSIEPWEQVTVR